jgi:predicted RNase H-like HicB family nuclease
LVVAHQRIVTLLSLGASSPCHLLEAVGEGHRAEVNDLRTFKFVVERDPETGVLVGSVPGWPGAHTQGADLAELQRNLREVIEMLLELCGLE